MNERQDAPLQMYCFILFCVTKSDFVFLKLENWTFGLQYVWNGPDRERFIRDRSFGFEGTVNGLAEGHVDTGGQGAENGPPFALCMNPLCELDACAFRYCQIHRAPTT
jgi:hypothetical protein